MRVPILQGSLRGCLVGVGIALALPFAAPAHGAPPVIAFLPLTPTTLTLPADGDAFVLYQVTNQSVTPRSFAMTPIVGIELVAGSSNCSNPFVLAAQQSCILALHLIGSQMAGNVSGGPVVCENGNPLLCYQPSPADQLQITLVPAQVATIDATPPALTIAIGHVAAVTVSNAIDSPVPAQNLSVDVPPGSSVVVDPGTCAASLPAGASCQFLISGTAAETATALVISGDNTTSTGVSVTLIDDVVFEDGFDALPSAQ